MIYDKLRLCLPTHQLKCGFSVWDVFAQSYTK